MFRGSSPTKIDDKGRLKVPTEFRRLLEERYGETPDVFITSITGESARLYPLSEWEQIEERLAAAPSSNQSVQKFLERVNYFGAQLKLDAQGRVVVPQILRERADVTGEVVVSGRIGHLEIWNRERFEKKLDEEPFTDDNFGDLAELGV